jgi:hypothetical protein
LKHRERTAADREDSCCFAIDWGGGRARHGQKAVFGARDTNIAEQPYTLLQRSMPTHPTVSELLPTLLGDLQPL